MQYNVKGKKYISTPFEYYFMDVGLRNAFFNFRQYEETHLMENILYNELLIRGILSMLEWWSIIRLKMERRCEKDWKSISFVTV